MEWRGLEKKKVKRRDYNRTPLCVQYRERLIYGYKCEENKEMNKRRYESSKVQTLVDSCMGHGCVTCFLLETPKYLCSHSLEPHTKRCLLSLYGNLFRPNNNDILPLAHKAARSQCYYLYVNSASFSTTPFSFSHFNYHFFFSKMEIFSGSFSALEGW